MLKLGQNWGKIANYPPQCSTKICTPALLGHGLFAFFLNTILVGEHVHSLERYDGILCGFRFLPTNSGMKTKKKRSRREILGFVVFFVLVRDFARTFGGTSCILGGHKPRNALQWHWACYFVLGDNSRLRGTSSDFREHGPEMPPRRWACSSFNFV